MAAKMRTQEIYADPRSNLKNEQWLILIALYRTLMHEHRDFFPSIPAPISGPGLRDLASTYAMPARMWSYDLYSSAKFCRKPGQLR